MYIAIVSTIAEIVYMRLCHERLAREIGGNHFLYV